MRHLHFLALVLQFQFSDCLTLPVDSTRMDIIKKGVTYDSVNGAVKSCIFCRIASKDEPATIVYEDSQFVVFKTIAPATKKHLLVTPKEHVKNLDSLSGPSDAAMVREMIKIGKIALGEDAVGAHYSFHVPPYNSIDHLHLHAIASPSTMTFLGKLKYMEGAFWCANAEKAWKQIEKKMIIRNEDEKKETITKIDSSNSKLESSSSFSTDDDMKKEINEYVVSGSNDECKEVNIRS